MRYDESRTDIRRPFLPIPRARTGATCLHWLTSIILFNLANLAFTASPARAQEITVYPPVLYAGINVLTITARNGLDKVSGHLGGRWTDLITGLSAPYIRIMSGATFVQCGTRVTFTVFVKTSQPIGLFELRVADCDGNIKYFDFQESETWNVYREDFGNVPLGATACHTFRVEARATDIIIDSVASRSAAFGIRYTNGRLPLRIRSGDIYEYDVCYNPTAVGRVQMPILVYIRRDYPAGGQTNFIVADTAYVNVVAPGTRPATPPIAAVRRKRPPSSELVAQPKPIILIAPPPIDTPRVIPKVLRSAARIIPPVTDTLRATPLDAGDPLALIAGEEEITDPTTFRTIIQPTARPIDSGKIFVANYDLVGWLFGYGLTDRLSLLGGFLYLPRFINFNAVGTVGGRYELYREGIVRGAVGMQANYSKSDASSIALLSPYGVVSVGDDDARASLVLGYTWRHHTPVTGDPFNRQAAVLGIGGDYRIGKNWKLAAEGYLLESASSQPLALTLRYFTQRFAIDAGLGIAIANTGTPVAAPVLNGTWVW